MVQPPHGSALPSRTRNLDKPQKLLRNGPRNMTKSSRLRPGLHVPRIPIRWSIRAMSQNKSDPWKPHCRGMNTGPLGVSLGFLTLPGHWWWIL